MTSPLASTGLVDVNTVILGITALVTALTPIILALINKKATKALANSEESRVAAVETVAASRATAESVEKVHVAVNSERTKLLAELQAMNDERKGDAITIARLIEELRGQKEKEKEKEKDSTP